MTSGLAPHAPQVGGFAEPSFLATVHRHQPIGLWQPLEGPDAFVPIIVAAEGFRFAGHEDLVDYRSPVGVGAPAALTELLGSRPDLELIVDSLPAEAATVMEDAAASAGREPVRRPDATTARLVVDGDFDDYLMALSKKERHEIRRKRRRYEEEMGPVSVERQSEPGPLLEGFIELHRQSEGEKGEFMTEAMVGFFTDVLQLDGWHVEALVEDRGKVAAAVFAFEDDDAYYLYNSGYDPNLRHLSPGIVLLGALIERTANSSRIIFDFLKGDESYKYRLGAQSRQLYTVTA